MAKELKHNKQHGIYAVIRANPVHYTHLDFYEVDLTLYFTLISVPYYHPEKILQIYVYKRNLQRCFMYFNRYIMYIMFIPGSTGISSALASFKHTGTVIHT